jgi:AraC-like DNA-binding protein
MSEKVVIGKRTREIVKVFDTEQVGLGLMAAGRTRAHAPYEISRDQIKGGHVIATFEGKGEFWMNGAWQPSTEGSVFLAPPGAAESFRPVKGSSWGFCWLHTYPKFFDLYQSSEPQLFTADIALFRHAVEGFIHSNHSDDDGKTSGPWADLVRFYAQRFMSGSTSGRHLEKIWAAVASEPAKPWSTESLSRLAGMSREQLRLHSRRETGRSPMQQVTHIRLQRAIQILQTCNYKQEVVAELVGYESAFAFSNAMHKVMGNRPSFYRRIE